jgi:hypothetical protein
LPTSPSTQARLLESVLGQADYAFLGTWCKAFIGSLLEHPPARLARLLYYQEETGADADATDVSILNWTNFRFEREAPLFAAWLEARRARLEEEYAPLVFRPPRGARCGPGGGSGGGGGGGGGPDAFVPWAVFKESDGVQL